MCRRLHALVVLLALASGAARAATGPPPLPADQVHRGDRAVVRTVFQGDSIESFEAEIVGVMSTGRTEGDLIVARATSERVQRLGVAQGMSGSPVYVNGRLIGALSSAWTFQKEPIFGITPIHEMLRVLELPVVGDSSDSAGPAGLDLPGLGGGGRFRGLGWVDDEEAEPAPEARVPAAFGPADAVPRPMPLPVACAGLHPGALEPLRRWLGPLGFTAVPGGRATAGGKDPARLEPGDAVAVDVLRGDLELSAIGTLTWREGDRVLIFGHPFFQTGEVRMPLSTAQITTVIANQANSFKLGVRGREAGVVTQDRRAAVAGRIGGRARMTPLAVSVTGPGRRQDFRFETIEDRTLAPGLIGVAALNSLLESGGIGANQTLRWTLAVHRRGAMPLRLSDVVAGDAPIQDLATAIGQPLRFLYNNPFARFTADSLAVTVAIEPGREQWTLRSARVQDAAVRPGGTVRLLCEIERWRGGRETRELLLSVPEETPSGRCFVWVGGGAELARYEARELPGRFRPSSIDDAWRRLQASRPSDGLYAALFVNAPDVTSDGRDYPELPASALSLLTSGQGAGDRARRGSVARLDERRLPMDGLTRGELLFQVTIDSKAP